MKFLAFIGGGDGPDVWEKHVDIDAADFADAAGMATAKAIEQGGQVFSLEQSDDWNQMETTYLDWLEKQPAIAIWQGSFDDSYLNIKLGRVGAPIVTITRMNSDGTELDGDTIGEGPNLRIAIARAMGEEG